MHCDLHKVQHKWCGTNVSDKERKNFIDYLTSMVNITKCECGGVGGLAVEFQANTKEDIKPHDFPTIHLHLNF